MTNPMGCTNLTDRQIAEETLAQCRKDSSCYTEKGIDPTRVFQISMTVANERGCHLALSSFSPIMHHFVTLVNGEQRTNPHCAKGMLPGGVLNNIGELKVAKQVLETCKKVETCQTNGQLNVAVVAQLVLETVRDQQVKLSVEGLQSIVGRVGRLFQKKTRPDDISER